jgi:hypothetical protein
LPKLPSENYIAGGATGAAFLRRDDFLFALRFVAFFFVAFFFAVFRFAVFRFAVFRFAAFFLVLRAGFLAAALRTVDRFFAARRFLAGFFFAVIGIETTPSTNSEAHKARPKTARI